MKTVAKIVGWGALALAGLLLACELFVLVLLSDAKTSVVQEHVIRANKRVTAWAFLVAIGVVLLVFTGCQFPQRGDLHDDNGDDVSCDEPTGVYKATLELRESKVGACNSITSITTDFGKDAAGPSCERLYEPGADCVFEMHYDCESRIGDELHRNSLHWTLKQHEDWLFVGELHLVFNEGTTWEPLDCRFDVALVEKESEL